LFILCILQVYDFITASHHGQKSEIPQAQRGHGGPQSQIQHMSTYDALNMLHSTAVNHVGKFRCIEFQIKLRILDILR